MTVFAFAAILAIVDIVDGVAGHTFLRRILKTLRWMARCAIDLLMRTFQRKVGFGVIKLCLRPCRGCVAAFALFAE